MHELVDTDIRQHPLRRAARADHIYMRVFGPAGVGQSRRHHCVATALAQFPDGLDNVWVALVAPVLIAGLLSGDTGISGGRQSCDEQSSDVKLHVVVFLCLLIRQNGRHRGSGYESARHSSLCLLRYNSKNCIRR